MTARSMGTLVEYRCHTGHRFGLRTLLDQKSKNIERLLEMALAQSEELSAALQSAMRNPDDEDTCSLRNELERRAREQELLRRISGNLDDPAQT